MDADEHNCQACMVFVFSIAFFEGGIGGGEGIL